MYDVFFFGFGNNKVIHNYLFVLNIINQSSSKCELGEGGGKNEGEGKKNDTLVNQRRNRT